MKPTFTLEDILGTQSRLAVLRLLYGVRVPLNASQIALRVRLTRPAVTAVLDHFAEMGIVRSSSAGRANVHLLERENIYVQRLIAPIFDAEQRLPRDLVDDLAEHFADLAESVILFGSYARGDQEQSSDVDVIFVAEDSKSKTRLENSVYDYAPEFHTRFGVSLSPIIYDAKEAAALPHTAPKLYESLIRDEVIVLGSGAPKWGGAIEA